MTQNQESKWIAISEKLPEIGDPVIVFCEYEEGDSWPKEEMFVGYRNDDGDLIVFPTNEDYGWKFEFCVTHWKKRSASPNDLNGASASEKRYDAQKNGYDDYCEAHDLPYNNECPECISLTP